MPDNLQPQPVSFGRPSARPAAPRGAVQRPVFGAPRSMDIAGGQRRPAFMPQQQSTQPAAVAPPTHHKPVQQHRAPAPHAQIRTGAPSERNTFLSTTQKPTVKKVAKQRSTDAPSSLPKIRVALLLIGVVLTLGGLARWTTAGSISGLSTSTGTVVSGKNGTQNIVFTAGSDNQKHTVPVDANKTLAAGSSVDVAYLPDSPEVDVKQVTPITFARTLGIVLFVLGIASLITSKVLRHVIASRRKHTTEPAGVHKPAPNIA